MAYIRRNTDTDPTDSGLTFESDGVEEFCAELHEFYFQLDLDQRLGRLKAYIDGIQWKHQKCYEEPPQCLSTPDTDSGTTLLPGKYTLAAKYDLIPLDGNPIPMPSGVDLEHIVCNANCSRDLRWRRAPEPNSQVPSRRDGIVQHPFNTFLDSLNEGTKEGDDGEGMLNLLELANVLCDDSTLGTNSKRRLRVTVAFRCYMKKSPCDGCEEYLDVTALGVNPRSEVSKRNASDKADIIGNSLGLEVDNLKFDQVTSEPKSGTPGVRDFLFNSDAYTGLNKAEIFTARLCELTEEILGDYDCEFKDLSPDDKDSKVARCLRTAVIGAFPAIVVNVLRGNGDRDDAQEAVMESLRKCLCKPADD